jgi:heat shock protein HslJ
VPIVEGYRITLTLEEDGVGGTAACNLYGGDVEIDGGDWRLGELSWTERGCEPDVMASEQAYLAALTAVDSVARDGEQLVLSGSGAELRFDELPPVPTAELVSTVWELDTLIEGDAASSVLGDQATLELRGDGTLEGSTGCRTLTGTYVVSGDEVVATSLAADAVIGDGFRAAIDGGRLTLTSEGDLGLGYRAR